MCYVQHFEAVGSLLPPWATSIFPVGRRTGWVAKNSANGHFGQGLVNRSMHQLLRTATHASHESLDGMFGSLDLTNREGFARFLGAHLIGTRALQASFDDFVSSELRLAPPDFAAMLEADLAAMQFDPHTLPAIEPDTAMAPAGIAYVISGSRLGLAMIRKQEYWNKQAGTASRYMEDMTGLAVWRALVGWMNERTPTEAEASAIGASAVYAFDVFREAFMLSEHWPSPARAPA